MCVAIPARLVSRDGDNGRIDLNGGTAVINLSLVPEARVGDWVLAHTGYALQVVTQAEAEETIALLREALR